MRKRQHVSTIETNSPSRGMGRGAPVAQPRLLGAPGGLQYRPTRNGGPLQDLQHQAMQPNNMVSSLKFSDKLLTALLDKLKLESGILCEYVIVSRLENVRFCCMNYGRSGSFFRF